MKKIYIIGGTMGVGKTTVCQLLKTKLPNSVFLDGDWCWDMHPFQITDETKAMVLDNICYLINNYIACPAFDHVIFCWVLHQQKITDEILSRLNTEHCEIKIISLICNRDELKHRLQKDICTGIRTSDIVERSIARIPLYDVLDSKKIDVSNMTPEQAASLIETMP